MNAGQASPRTVAEPMAFTREDFWRGAGAAWWMYLIALAVISVAIGATAGGFWIAVVAYTGLFGAPVAFVAMLVWALPAYGLGRALRRVASPVVHVLLFALLGGVVGPVTMSVFLGLMGSGSIVDPAFAPYALAPVVTVPLAWWWTWRRALRADRGRLRPAPVDPDAAAEDAILDAEPQASDPPH